MIGTLLLQNTADILFNSYTRMGSFTCYVTPITGAGGYLDLLGYCLMYM